MIYTVTLNPALDYVVKIEHFTLGKVNRTTQEDLCYGGKGLNVSAVLANLGYVSVALGFVAGFTGDEIVRGAETLGFQPDFIRVDKGMSRINIKLKSESESEINGIGPEITQKDVERLFQKLEILKAGDMLVLSGSIPNSMEPNIYEKIMKQFDGKGIIITVDAEKELLLPVLHYHPFLIKPNQQELEAMFDVILTTEEEIIFYAQKLQSLGARNVLVSRAGDGAILADEDGKIHRIAVPRGVVQNSVGAGDSMVAGFLAGYAERREYAYALKLGTAAGSASAFSERLATEEEIMKQYRQLA